MIYKKTIENLLRKYGSEDVAGAALPKGMVDDALAYLKSAKKLDRETVGQVIMDTVVFVLSSQIVGEPAPDTDRGVLNEKQKRALSDAILASIRKTN